MYIKSYKKSDIPLTALFKHVETISVKINILE